MKGLKVRGDDNTIEREAGEMRTRGGKSSTPSLRHGIGCETKARKRRDARYKRAEVREGEIHTPINFQIFQAGHQLNCTEFHMAVQMKFTKMRKLGKVRG
jgi:hypothetical protein